SLIVIAFVGIMMHVNRMVFGRPEEPLARVVIPLTCRLAIVMAAIPVAVLGVYIPSPLYHLLNLAAQQLGGR
ncbi:MAG: hypothetical protein WBD26_19280, partial [Candidatus Acidiferrales bacterium]